MFEKAPQNSAADYVFLDLEDAVSPMTKYKLEQVIKALNENELERRKKTISF